MVKILDFGVANAPSMRAQGELTLTLTETGLVVGTLAYMSPEQLRGDPVDERADVFSVGMMALEALTRNLPKRNSDGTPVPSALPKLPEAVMACLANNPDGRCASLADIRENLVSALQTLWGRAVRRQCLSY